MKLHDMAYFQHLIENIVMWAVVGLFCLILFCIIVGPLILAYAVSPMWLLAYVVYAVVIVIAALSGKGGMDNADY